MLLHLSQSHTVMLQCNNFRADRRQGPCGGAKHLVLLFDAREISIPPVPCFPPNATSPRTIIHFTAVPFNINQEACRCTSHSFTKRCGRSSCEAEEAGRRVPGRVRWHVLDEWSIVYLLINL